MTASPIIAVDSRVPKKICVGALQIDSAPTVPEMCSVLGRPSRVDSGQQEAPYGHRNNQIHIYDDLGVTFNEHHYTQRVQDICCWFQTDDPPFRFTPKGQFEGLLIFEDVVMPNGGDVREFFSQSPFNFDDRFGGSWLYRFGDFSIYLDSRGDKLPSGKRSKKCKVQYLSLSWPHDPRQAPVVGEN
jgi:hypothetical protein